MMVFYPGEELCEGMVEHCKHHAWSEEKKMKAIKGLKHKAGGLMHERQKLEEKRAEMHKHSGMCM